MTGAILNAKTLLITGGTGTLGRELVARLNRDGRATVVVLTRRPAAGAAVLPPNVRTLAGDVRDEGFGLAPAVRSELASRVTDILHCAAETTFNRPLAEARAANVDGTRAVLDFARDCAHLERLACFSTVYVAGRSTGCFTEADIGGTDGFVNSYEQSKAEMETVVRDAKITLE